MSTQLKIVGTVQRVRFAGRWTDFTLKVGERATQREGHFYHFTTNKNDFFCWRWGRYGQVQRSHSVFSPVAVAQYLEGGLSVRDAG